MIEKNVNAQEETQVAVQEGTATAVFNPQTVAEKLMSGAHGNFLTTIADDKTPATRARIYNAINDNDGKLRDMIGKTLEVTDMMAFPCSLVNEDGEMEDAIRVVLITKDGKSYGSVANGIFTAMQNIVAICGMGPWVGLKLTPVEKTTRKGYRTLVLRMEA